MGCPFTSSIVQSQYIIIINQIYCHANSHQKEVIGKMIAWRKCWRKIRFLNYSFFHLVFRENVENMPGKLRHKFQLFFSKTIKFLGPFLPIQYISFFFREKSVAAGKVSNGSKSIYNRQTW